MMRNNLPDEIIVLGMVSSTETAEIVESLTDTARIERVNGAIYVYNL